MISVLPERLKELRKSYKMTQNDLAKRIKVSQQTIGGWEIGRTEPSTELLTKMADLFDVSIDYLVGRTNKKHEDILTAAHLDEDINKLSPEQRKAIYDFIEFQKQKIDEDNKKD